ncbi:MAG: helicase HerA-like domain-containing protein [Methanobacteriaceae archaeon]
MGETSLIGVNFISNSLPKVGEYVIMEYDGKTILGMIENLNRLSLSLNDDISSVEIIEKIKAISGNDSYVKGTVTILGDIHDNLKIPSSPAPPGTNINLASKEILEKIFHSNGLKLGTLISQSDVDLKLDINAMVSRHLAILAMTGSGKSNTVSVIVDGLLAEKGCVLIFDMHSEYVSNKFENGNVNVIKAEINPNYMSFSELKELINIKGNAILQERYFRKAYESAKNAVKLGESRENEFIEIMEQYLERKVNDDEIDAKSKKPIFDVLNKIDDLKRRYGSILNLNTGNILSQIKLGQVNIVDLGQSDDLASEVIVSHILRLSLKDRKEYVKYGGKGNINNINNNNTNNNNNNINNTNTNTNNNTNNNNINNNTINSNIKLKFPVFYILEEAHILAPQGRDTKSKYWIRRIAREGRKFGLGLCLVSQSPKTVDSDALSQANNMIILRLVSPNDQRHVQTASENLSEDLLKQLPSLNIGEAIVLGLMVKVPTMVKVDEFKGTSIGGDIDIVNEWKNQKNLIEENLNRQKKEYNELGGDY